MASIPANKIPFHTYEWSIPSISVQRQLLLCYGYSRGNSIKISKVPITVFDLVANYFTPNDDEFTIDEIKNAAKGQTFRSPAFGTNDYKWCLRLHPNGFPSKFDDEVILGLECISNLEDEAKIICLVSLNIVGSSSGSFNGSLAKFSENKKKSNWLSGTMKCDELKQMDQIICQVKLQLIDALDDDGDSVDLTEAENVIEQITKISKMKQRQTHIEKLKEKEKTQQLINWLQYKVELPEYTELFIDNGVEDLLTVQLITMDTLNKIGINKIGHRLKIMHFVEMLNNKGNNDDNNNNKQSLKRAFEEVDDDDDDENIINTEPFIKRFKKM